jgi:hypothetical protein
MLHVVPLTEVAQVEVAKALRKRTKDEKDIIL